VPTSLAETVASNAFSMKTRIVPPTAATMQTLADR
jgi:hypothetical protein